MSIWSITVRSRRTGISFILDISAESKAAAVKHVRSIYSNRWSVE